MTTLLKKVASNKMELLKKQDEIKYLWGKLVSAERSLAKHDNEYQDKKDELQLMIRQKDSKIKELMKRLSDPYHTPISFDRLNAYIAAHPVKRPQLSSDK